MSSTIRNHSILSRIGSFIFARQKPHAAAGRHPSLLNAVRNWRARRAAVAELNALTDRSLDDIGLTREEIAAVTAR